jgi:hypothetical protein
MFSNSGGIEPWRDWAPHLSSVTLPVEVQKTSGIPDICDVEPK